MLSADPSKTHEILNNLIGNAIKFTDKGQIVLSSTRNGDLLQVSITDSGIGITKTDQDKLFSKFQQISSGQAGRPVGTGLGLYISREYCKMMGGNLWVANSIIGQGSVFTFSLPISGTKTAEDIGQKLTHLN
jgi:signal transduction histidine kinase